MVAKRTRNTTAQKEVAQVSEIAALVLRQISAAAESKSGVERLFFPNGIDSISMNISAGGVTVGFLVQGPQSRAYAEGLLLFAEFVLLSQSSTDFRRYSPAMNQWGTVGAIEVPTKAAATLHGSDPNLYFSVGDISLKGGGPMPGHTSGHQQGRNIDVRPIRTDRQDIPVTYKSNAYDRAATQRAIDAFLAQSNVDYVIFNDPGINGVKHDADGGTTHDNHFHVQTKA